MSRIWMYTERCETQQTTEMSLRLWTLWCYDIELSVDYCIVLWIFITILLLTVHHPAFSKLYHTM